VDTEQGNNCVRLSETAIQKVVEACNRWECKKKFGGSLHLRQGFNAPNVRFLQKLGQFEITPIEVISITYRSFH
jgi:hypothetical protein